MFPDRSQKSEKAGKRYYFHDYFQMIESKLKESNGNMHGSESETGNASTSDQVGLTT